jgi:hypothetical protein
VKLNRKFCNSYVFVKRVLAAASVKKGSKSPAVMLDFFVFNTMVNIVSVSHLKRITGLQLKKVSIDTF